MPLMHGQRVRLANLRLQLLQVQRRRDYLMAAFLLEEQRQHQQQRRRTMWVKPWLLRRVTLGHYDTLMQELMRESRGDFKSYLRMEPEMFREMLDRVSPRIEKSQQGRPPLSPGLKLAITLRFLSTGNSYHSLAFNFRVAHNTICLFVPEVCDAVVMEFENDVFVTPSTPDSWKEVAGNFGKRWNFHHACGALDGKHIAIKKPKKSGSAYYNYKGFFSIVLLGLVDADSICTRRTDTFCYRTVIVRSSCGAHTIDITPCGARPVPEQEPHGRRTVSVGAPCGLFTSAVRYDPGIFHGRRTASRDM